MSSQQNIHMVAEPVVHIGKLFSGDVASPDQDQVNDPEVKAMRQLYQMVVGSLIWAQRTGRFDINTALLHLCRFMSNPGEKHTQA